ncbi:ABC transporter substrate-binding protein [Acuticoccus sp. MNP-M23]|uniref:ABC transporter substrate-binding protein n=1 Tax=Acuticoccus sp. MNP-M23 TaxID=3072793 RepID=UPI0028153B35|nr:ABC transporter substrate-binding protein [Acuticoccus sp. MNP-M23]WMS41052.1 ABC transporter substrate-binding protein [Acuticoccus sp. MNP-M23]
MISRRSVLKAGAAAGLASALPFASILPASAAGDVLVGVHGETINSLDIHRTGTNRPSYQVAVNCYDRLVKFGIKEMDDGSLSYDYSVIEPDLAESWDVSEDGKTITFTMKDGVKFQDGSPVTAQDVKWSFDRAVTVGGFPSSQMKAGGFERPEQFSAPDDKTFVITLDRASKLAIPDLAVPVPFILNSKVAKANATADDPWALEYVHKNTIGSGAFSVSRWDPGQQIVYDRNDEWHGDLPGVQRVILREVPSPATRRALIERGDVQLSFNIPNKDAKELAEAGLEVYSTPVENSINVVGLNYNFDPFKDPDVRKAVAYAIPYEEIFQTAAYGRGVPMWGSDKVEGTAWPQPSPYYTDLDKAKEHLAKSGYADGFDVPFSIDLNQLDWMEPTALLIIENLKKIGINATLEKIPGANWRTASLVEKRLPLHLEGFGGWLNYPDYYFFWAYQDGKLFNSSNYSNPEIETLVSETLHLPVDDPEWAPKIERMIEVAFEDIPRIPLWQTALNVASNGADGYAYWFHRQLDARTLSVEKD